MELRGADKVFDRMNELQSRLNANFGARKKESFESALQGSIAPMKPKMFGLEPVGGNEIENIMVRIAQEEGVDANLVRAVVQQESGFNSGAVSHAGAQGLMQLMPSTAKALGVTDPFNPEQNLRGGTRYLRQLLDQFGGNVEHALAAYNAGPGAVKKYGGIPPYSETQNYVRKIMSNYQGISGVIGG